MAKVDFLKKEQKEKIKKLEKKLKQAMKSE